MVVGRRGHTLVVWHTHITVLVGMDCLHVELKEQYQYKHDGYYQVMKWWLDQWQRPSYQQQLREREKGGGGEGEGGRRKERQRKTRNHVQNDNEKEIK